MGLVDSETLFTFHSYAVFDGMNPRLGSLSSQEPVS